VPDLLVDTDVLVDQLRGTRRLPPGGYRYSVITRCELFAGRPTDEDPVRRLLATMREVVVDREIAELAGRLRRELRIATPDALIAATALQQGVALLTRNRGHFASVPGLELAPRAGDAPAGS
jgi:predicted nucleic acid-binding protein